jgi:uncharacterized cupredoxin-like copper-binding protein
MSPSQIVVLLFGISLTILIAWYFWFAPKGRTLAATGASGVQEVAVTVRGGYTPDVIVVKAGQPVRLRFTRQESSSCSEMVLFPDFNQSAKLPEGASMSYRKIIYFIMITVLVASFLAACGVQPSGLARPVEVQITLTEYEIKSALADFQAGVPYHFVVTNQGALAHEIMLVEPMETSAHMNMGEMDQMALAYIDAKVLPAGATASFDYTFTKPAMAGEIEIACHTPGHYELGMKLPITVK